MWVKSNHSSVSLMEVVKQSNGALAPPSGRSQVLPSAEETGTVQILQVCV